MHKIINFILLFLILTFGNILAPEHVLTDGWKTTLLVTVICFIAEAILSAISSILPILALKISEHFVPAFAVNGTLTYIVLMLCINLLSVSKSKSQKGNTDK